MLASTIAVHPALAALTTELARCGRLPPDFPAVVRHYRVIDDALATISHAVERDMACLAAHARDAYFTALSFAKLLAAFTTEDPEVRARITRMTGHAVRMLDLLDRFVTPFDRAVRTRLSPPGVDEPPGISHTPSASVPRTRGGN